MTELRPCPFCGGKAWAYSGTTYHFESGFGWICACKSCDAQGQIGETKKAAVMNWNRRTPGTCRNTVIEKDKCGMDFQCSHCELSWSFTVGSLKDNEFFFCPKCGREVVE